ncbi:MAG: hypothetical protein LBM63_04445 [Rikenellaceae bacterium]|nr:hypothetical protein [Rikenellaceae bacterium]
MKRLVLISLLFVFATCDIQDDRIWDFNNPNVCFFVKNAAGENLLDPNVEGNILDNEITVDYNGQVFGMDSVQTRALPPVWYGLRVEPYSDVLDGTPVLKFGEFSPVEDYHGETFTINWGDDTSDEVKFDLYIKREPNVIKSLWFNGELLPKPTTLNFVLNIVK